MNNRGLLVVIAVLLVGVLAILLVQNHRENKPLDERISDSVGEVVEEVGDEIDDNTTSHN